MTQETELIACGIVRITVDIPQLSVVRIAKMQDMVVNSEML